MGEVVTDLLLAASLESQPQRRTPVDIREIATAASDAARATADRGVRVVGPEAGPRAIVLGGAGPLRRVVDALLDNARRHAPAGGNVHVGVESVGDHVVLRVADDGPGLDP